MRHEQLAADPRPVLDELTSDLGLPRARLDQAVAHVRRADDLDSGTIGDPAAAAIWRLLDGVSGPWRVPDSVDDLAPLDPWPLGRPSRRRMAAHAARTARRLRS